MFRIRAVRQLLLEDVAGLSRPRESSGSRPDGADLDRARKRAIAVVAVDWLAIVALVVARAGSGNILPIGPTEDTLLTVGLLAIAVHSGFRLGQLEKFGAVDRVIHELDVRAGGESAVDD